MATHTVVLELSQDAYQALQQKIQSGAYTSASDVMEDALLDISLPTDSLPPGRAYKQWINDEAIAAYDEFMASPDEVFTSEQVLAYLEEQRAVVAKAG